MTEEFNSLAEVEKYYNIKTNTYEFKENGKYIDLVIFNFDLNVEANIDARDILAHNMSTWNITARNIKTLDIDAWHTIIADNIAASNINAWDIEAKTITAFDINAWDIKALDITAHDISYLALCSAQRYIRCSSINGRKGNSKHFAFSGLDVIEESTATEEEIKEEVKQTTTHTTSVVVKSCDKA